MKIGFDAKRAYHNTTGLGNYSRTLIESLAENYPEHEYFLFNPKPSTVSFGNKHLHEVLPSGAISKLFSSAWRSNGIKRDLKKLGIDLYHGLSHELPFNIHKTGIKSVVTMHDLIPERFPEQYNPIDVKIYHKKFLYACEHADKIIAISKQTKDDIIEFYKIHPGKINVCYQSCHPSFAIPADHKTKRQVIAKYNLPESFYLTVGSVIERKNLLTICKAMALNRNPTPLVVIGDGGKYKQVVKEFIAQNNLNKVVIFLSEQQTRPSFSDFPAIYQSAIAMIYPSAFEGFGIPVLEALFSGLPVITSNVSSLPEAGGDGPIYIDPDSSEQIADAMKRVSNNELRKTMIHKGWLHAQHFTPAICAASVMKVYNMLW